MTPYVDYDFYTDTYLGTVISTGDFPHLALRSTMEIDLMTFDRAKAVIVAESDTDLIEKIQLATCAVAEALKRLDSNNGQVIQSESIGRASVTYFDPRSKQSQLVDIAKLFLASSGLMYRGIDE